jgi:hypothetical protein
MTRANIRRKSPEIAALLNPALISLLLAHATKGYHRETTSGLPFVYAPIVATISLHPNARGTLSMNVTTPFATWIERSAELRVTLQDMIVEMVPIVNEGLLFALSYDVLRIENATLIQGNSGPKGTIRADTSDMEQAQRTAAYLGRWLARAGSPSTVCAMLGVTP